MEGLADVGYRWAEEIAPKNHRADPEDSPNHIKGDVAQIRHERGARHRRAERPNDGHEARKNDRAAPIFFIEVMRALKMAAPEEERVLLSIQSRPGGAANPVAKLVSDDGAGHDGQQKPPQRNHSSGGKKAGSDQQGIAPQKEPNQQDGFDENDDTDPAPPPPADSPSNA